MSTFLSTVGRNGRRTAAGKRPDARARLAVERLDDRSTPAVLWVTSSADSGAGTLRDTLAAAVDGDDIRFALPAGETAVKLTTGGLYVWQDVTIDGGAANAVTVTRDTSGPDPVPEFRIFTFAATADAVLAGLQITGGYIAGWQGYGAGVYNAVGGELTLDHAAVENNTAQSFATLDVPSRSAGGGVYNDGTLTVYRSVVQDNTSYSLPLGFNVSGSTAAFGAGVWSAGRLTIRDTTVSNNSTDYYPLTRGWQSYPGTFNTPGEAYGGGIWNSDEATLTVSLSVIRANTNTLPGGSPLATKGYGAGVYNAGTAAITDSRVEANYAGSALSLQSVMLGGGVFNALDATLTITRSAFLGNQVSGGLQRGGGLYNLGVATVTNSTFSGNKARNGVTTSLSQGDGGAIANVHSALNPTNGLIAISFSTIAENESLSVVMPGQGTATSSTGGGIWAPGGGVTIGSTIVALNESAYIHSYPFNEIPTSGADVYGPLAPVTSTGYNLIGRTNNSGGWVGTDLTGTDLSPLDPELQSIRDNGGPAVGPSWVAPWWVYTHLPTYRPFIGSPVIDAGDPTNPPATDQRGFARDPVSPFIGAYEGEPADPNEGGGGGGGGGPPGGPPGGGYAPQGGPGGIPINLSGLWIDPWGHDDEDDDGVRLI